MKCVIYPEKFKTSLAHRLGLDGIDQAEWAVDHIPLKTTKFLDGSFEIEPFHLSKPYSQITVYVPSHLDASFQFMWTLYVLHVIKSESHAPLDLILPYIGFSRSEAFTSWLQMLPLDYDDTLHVLDLHTPFHGKKSFHIKEHSSRQRLSRLLTDFDVGDSGVLVFPDQGSKERLSGLEKDLNVNSVIANKIRNHEGVNLSLDIISYNRDKTYWIIDDVCDSGETIYKCSALLREYGVRKVNAFVTHFYDRKASQEMVNSIDDIYFINTVTDWSGGWSGARFGEGQNHVGPDAMKSQSMGSQSFTNSPKKGQKIQLPFDFDIS